VVYTYVTGKEGEIENSITRTVTVAEKLEATFDFVNDYNTVFAGWPTGSVTDKQQDKTAVAGVVKLHATGRLTVFESTATADKGTHTLRLYKGQGAAKAGAVELSVADGYYITGITITGATLGNIGYTEEFTNTDTSISSKTYTATATANIKTITVKYAPVPATEIVGLSYKLTGKSKAIVVDYTIHIKNHKDTDTYKLMLSVDGGEPIEITPEGTPALRAEGTPEAAPARVATGANASFEHLAEGATHDLAGTYTATIDEDKAAKHTVSLAVHLNDAETADHTADAVTIGTTTGIENVTVDAAEAAEYYTLQGIRVAEPQAGQVYIVRRGATATKELVK
ncbi:MAG: hypothetical protein K2L74_08970, partial [Muribaculaceae bacterium]|nr:hypothetical protein [Muribaculaceae bacterium]